MILDPERSKQIFYSAKFAKGCSLVAFYNHRVWRRFTDAQIEEMKKLAHELFSDIPWHVYGPRADRKCWQLYVIVEISDRQVVVSLALRGNQTRIRHQNWKRTKGYKPGIVTIRRAMKHCACAWRSRPKNGLSDNPSMTGGIVDEV